MKYSSVVLMVCLAVSATSAVELTDHPLVTRYPESQLSRKDVKEFDAYELIVGLDDSQNPVSRTLEGKVSRLGYYQPRERSILEIYRNYEQALTEAGLETIFACANDECGPAYASSAWNRLSGITAKSGAECRYLAGKIESDDSVIYVALMVGRNRHNLHVIEVQEMETGLVTVNADVMAERIAADGRVSVYGIYFDTGKATLKSKSKPALDEIARLTELLAELEIYVVGHTDSTGGFEMNLTLSRDRAAAVVKVLVEQYGVDPGRLSPHGVGPLCPASTNRTDDGKAENRRVELVEQ